MGLFIKGEKMAKIISSRCGKGICQFYDKNNHVSKCSKYSDRKECSLSNKNRRKVANKSRKDNLIYNP